MPLPPPHIMVFPYPAQGHLLPMLDLTHQLCLNGVTVSIIVTPQNLPYLSSLLSAHPYAVSAVTLPFPHHPSLPSGVENVKELGSSGHPLVMASLRQLREPIINSDFFLGWTNDLRIPRFAFFTSGAFLASVLHFVSDKLHLFESTDPVCFWDLPRSPVFKTEHIPTLTPQSPSSQDAESVRDITMNFSSVVFSILVSVWKRNTWSMRSRKWVITGFSVLARFFSIGLGKGHSDSNVDTKALLRWLDGCPDGSVLYICFGSQKVLTKEQCDALALGLELSMTKFVWVAKTDPIPDGFEERLAGRGMVVTGWAPQVIVLSHVAVGGFLSHCGWNSVLEAIASGKMILAWPMEADQFVDARLLVEHMGVAVRICEGGKTVPDPQVLGGIVAETMAAPAQGKFNP